MLRRGNVNKSRIHKHTARNDIPLEGAGFDATATLPRWHGVETSREGFRGVVRLVNAITAHASRGAVKVWRVDGVESRFSPVPVRDVTIVPALVAQRCLKGVDIISVPSEEVGLNRRVSAKPSVRPKCHR